VHLQWQARASKRRSALCHLALVLFFFVFFLALWRRHRVSTARADSAPPHAGFKRARSDSQLTKLAAPPSDASSDSDCQPVMDAEDLEVLLQASSPRTPPAGRRSFATDADARPLPASRSARGGAAAAPSSQVWPQCFMRCGAARTLGGMAHLQLKACARAGQQCAGQRAVRAAVRLGGDFERGRCAGQQQRRGGAGAPCAGLCTALPAAAAPAAAPERGGVDSERACGAGVRRHARSAPRSLASARAAGVAAAARAARCGGCRRPGDCISDLTAAGEWRGGCVLHTIGVRRGVGRGRERRALLCVRCASG
jgi:hypothetical protein